MSAPAGSSPFSPTRWSLVLRARGDGAEARRAREDLCRAYWFPLYAWARREGRGREDAEDLVQSFLAEVIARDLFARADGERGRLRTFLLTAFRRHAIDAWAKSTAARRGGGRVIAFDPAEADALYEAEARAPGTPAEIYDRQWALTLLEQALSALEAEAEARGRGREFRALRPFVASEADPAAAPPGMSANAFHVAVHRLRGRFRQALTEAVRASLDEPDEAAVQAELRHLLAALTA